MYIALHHSNATSLATFHQTGLVNILHMVALMLACVIRIICNVIEQSCYNTSNTSLYATHCRGYSPYSSAVQARQY